jgi:hypothetical protein
MSESSVVGGCAKKIQLGGPEPFRVIIQQAESFVAVSAQQTSYSATGVVVIDVETTGFGCPADGAYASLAIPKSFVLGKRKSVVFLEVSFAVGALDLLSILFLVRALVFEISLRICLSPGLNASYILGPTLWITPQDALSFVMTRLAVGATLIEVGSWLDDAAPCAPSRLRRRTRHPFEAHLAHTA